MPNLPGTDVKPSDIFEDPDFLKEKDQVITEKMENSPKAKEKVHLKKLKMKYDLMGRRVKDEPEPDPKQGLDIVEDEMNKIYKQNV